MILLIDNYDSFTYNLYQLVESLGFETKVYLNDKITISEIEKLNPDKIIISPGPRTPQYAGICVDLIKKFYDKKPILGVCLGLQCLGVAFGVEVIQSKKLMYGKTDLIKHNSSKLFEGITNPFKAARYNSLVLDSIPTDFEITAWDNTNDIMAMQQKYYPLYGVQFHPESFMTEVGNKLVGNFLNEDFNY
jgi:anthranilate synthase component II